MLVQMAMHRAVKPEKEAEMIESMVRFGRAMVGSPGFRQTYSLKDPKSGALVGLAIWDSAEALAAARPAMGRALEGVDFSQLEDSAPEVFLFEIKWAGGELHNTD